MAKKKKVATERVAAVASKARACRHRRRRRRRHRRCRRRCCRRRRRRCCRRRRRCCRCLRCLLRTRARTYKVERACWQRRARARARRSASEQTRLAHSLACLSRLFEQKSGDAKTSKCGNSSKALHNYSSERRARARNALRAGARLVASLEHVANRVAENAKKLQMAAFGVELRAPLAT